MKPPLTSPAIFSMYTREYYKNASKGTSLPKEKEPQLRKDTFVERQRQPEIKRQKTLNVQRFDARLEYVTSPNHKRESCIEAPKTSADHRRF